ncbi:amino acid adenylation domain-containing protein [Nostoc sp.]|uniref:amino acid adenylation domain-containing protein n=1 Tax=Nostoc sp. TaxID=1180 RepID=UPI002FF9B0C4
MNIKKDDISKRRSQLSPAKQAILEKRLRGESDTPQIVIPQRSQQSPVPLSFAQQRLWLFQQLEPESSAYNELVNIHLKGVLNLVALRDSLNEIVKRHESLRTTFELWEGQPVQVINSMTVALPVVNLSELPTALQSSEVEKLTIDIVKKPFDLASGPLLRGALLQTSEEEYVLLFVIHHIVCDGWSVQIFTQELTALYAAFSAGKPSPLSELPIQYVDFSVWQRQWLQGEREKTQLSYWKQQLANVPSTLPLPTERPRPPVQSFRGAIASYQLSAPLTSMLKSLSNQQGVTLFMTLLTAFQAQLYRYTNQEDICVGSPIANRNHRDIQGLIGFFVNTLVLRTDLSGNPSFLELLGRVREVCMGAYAHSDIPFDRLVGELHPERNLSHTPLFQVMFVLQEDSKKDLELPDLTLKWLHNHTGTAKFDLTLSVVDAKSELWGFWEYNTDLFDAATIDRMIGHFTNLLEGIVTDPDQRLSDLPLLTIAEQQTLLVKWNDTTTNYSEDKCIHELFEAQVERTPNDVAVVFEDEQLTYSELNKRANQLAHYLRTLGVKSEVLVGICVERSLSMVIGLLAILKAGGAYVPLDPSYPQERKAFMLQDSQPKVLLTQQQLVESLPTHTAKVVCLDSNWEIISQHSQENPACHLSLDNLAYVIYTSGSTGQPKGAMNSHRGICNRLLWMQSTYQLTASDRVLQKTPFSFDVSVWEFFWPLITGARLVVAQPEGHRDTNYLVNVIREQQISTIHFVPSMLQVFLEAKGLENCQCLKRVIVSGEALPLQLQQRFFNRLDAQLHNLYGPTEAAVDVTFWACRQQSSLEDNNISQQKTVSIGRPIDNIQIYLLDRHLNLVPVGVTGELYIGGVGVGRGYLNRPELTAEKFIPNPFQTGRGAGEQGSRGGKEDQSLNSERLYKTGDLARYLANGEIEYIGRIDYQVKIRGFRIELSEIEASISQHTAVRETVVVADAQRIVAYVVLHTEQTLKISELRNFLESKLPHYMVPAAFVMLDQLPLTPNGKVDRKALPEPDHIRPEFEETYIAPQTTVQKQLSAIWAQVLGLEKVGINDKFFELGGDSILSFQVISKANLAGLYLTPKQLFQHQTIAELATVASTNISMSAEQGLVTGSFPLTPIQRWFFEENFSNYHHYNQAVLLEVQQALNPVLLEQVIHYLLQHHDILRSQFIQQSSKWQAKIAEFEQVVPITVIDLSTLPPESQSAAIAATCSELQASLNLFSGQLLRVALFNLGVNQHSRLFIVIHHLVVDGVSWRILLEDLQTAYAQLSRGEKIKLSPKTTSFKQWADQLQQYTQSAAAQAEIDYWLEILRQPRSSLPVDYPGGDNTINSVDNVTIGLSAEETQALLQDVPAAYRTQINDVLLVALVQAFAKWTGQTTLLLDLEGHGREEILTDADISRTIGWFTSLFPIVLSVEETSNPGEALKMVKEQLRQIPNRGIGYGVLYYLNEDRKMTEVLRSLPKAEVIFNYLGQLDQVLNTSSMFKFASESEGNNQSDRNHRPYLLEIDGSIISSQLKLQWRYSRNLHKQSTVETLAQGFIEALRSIIAHCQSPQGVGFTPSDFPLVQLNQAELDLALQQISF